MLNAIFQTLISLAKILIKSRSTNLSKFQGKQQIIVVGNGPSAKPLLTDFINNIDHTSNNTDIMCVNMFASQNLFTQVKPSQYLFLDQAFFDFDLTILDSPENLPLLKIKPQFLETQKLINKTWRNILNADWPITLHIPNQFKNSPIVLAAKKQNIFVIHFNYTVVKGLQTFENYCYKLGLGSPQSQNVITSCIFHCINLNFKEIYLIGTENNFFLNFHLDNNNQLYIKDDHFYEVEQKLTPLFHANGSPVTMADQMSNLLKVFRSHQRLQQYAQFRNSVVYNATPNSFIDAYPRKNLPT